MNKDAKLVNQNDVKNMDNEKLLGLYERRVFINGVIDSSDEGKEVTDILKNEILKRMGDKYE